MEQLVTNSIQGQNIESSDQNKVTREVLQTTTEVADQASSLSIEEEQKLSEKQANTQEEIIDQIVSQQSDKNNFQIAAQVANQLSTAEGFEALLPQQVVQNLD